MFDSPKGVAFVPWNNSMLTTLTHLYLIQVLYEPDSVACTIHIKNLKETVSGGHKFVVMYIQVQMPRTEQAEPRKAWREWLGIS